MRWQVKNHSGAQWNWQLCCAYTNTTKYWKWWIGDKLQNKKEFIIHNNLSNTIWNQVTDMIQKFDPPLLGQLDHGTWMYYNPIPFLEDKNTTVPPPKVTIWYRCLTSEETSCINDSITLLNVYNSILYTEGNACGIITISVIEITFKNYYIYVMYDL